MKVGLMGFGKAGKAVASVLLQNKQFSLEWVFRERDRYTDRTVPDLLGIESNEPGLIFSKENISMSDLLDIHPVDYIVDFSSTKGIDEYGKEAAKRNVKIISAISHYTLDEIALLKKLAKKTVVFWSPNITLGINFLMFASKYLKKIAPKTDIEIIEQHFKKKHGVSGTAIKIAENLKISKSNINSIRVGGIVGKHELVFGFPYQTVRLVHESISREAFGSGVVFVAENLKDKNNGLYDFNDILVPYFEN